VGLSLLWGTSDVAALATVVAISAVLGFREDLSGVTVRRRVLVQGVAALVLVVCACVGNSPWWLLLAPVGIFFVLGVINAVNFMDGINGISASVGVTIGLLFSCSYLLLGQQDLAAAALVVAAACAGFLPYNAWRARVFLGDSGSYGLGAAIAGLCVFSLSSGGTLEVALAPVAVYLADTGTVIVRRAFRRESLHSAHRQHVYQRLVDLGWSHQVVTGIVTGFTLAVGCLGLASLAGGWPRVLADIFALLLVLLYLGLPRIAFALDTRDGIVTG
jgi:UDP-N-acetylmuramyl pentapeptide phosphotransferase/UDP-N-acetylglucosamine-1-phosphate transferase